jgi:integrase/recombinase XerC
MAVNQFLDFLKFEKRYSAHTLKAYSSDLRDFLDFMNITYQTNDLLQTDFFQVRSWIVSLLEQNICPKSVKRKISCLKSFFSFAVKNNFIFKNPMDKISSPKSSEKLPVFIEKTALENLLSGGNFEDTSEGKRDRLILETFYCTGMRISELINIRVMDIDFYRSAVKVSGKRNKERIIPILPHLKAMIEEFVNTNSLVSNPENFLFTNQKGKKLNPKMVYSIVNFYLSKVTTADQRSPHVLRHSFATHMLDNGSDLNAIKEILGHSSLQATQVYTHNTIEKLKNIYKKAHPRA